MDRGDGRQWRWIDGGDRWWGWMVGMDGEDGRRRRWKTVGWRDGEMNGKKKKQGNHHLFCRVTTATREEKFA